MRHNMVETWVVDIRVRDEATGEFTTAEVMLSFNVDAVAQALGSKATKSKHGRATAMHGAIRTRITRVKP